MANTEGMSQEVLESLLLQQPPSRSSAANDTSSRSSALGRRMEMPMGERPAATVIRASKNKRPGPLVTPTDPLSVPEEDRNETGALRTSPIAVLGDVVERKSPRRRRKQQQPPSDNQSSRPTSRFASRARQQQHPTTGFPSLQVPLGRLIHAKQQHHDTNEHRSRKETKAVIKAEDTAADEVTAAARQAQSMLEQMSVQEIQQQQQELQSALAPETLAFLKQRHRHHNNRKAPGSRVVLPSSNEKVSQDDDDDDDDEDELAEKERLAQVLSSVKNYQDLDAVYAQEMGGRQHNDGEAAVTTASEFDNACELLRSSVPRQNLWAARVVCRTLRNDIEQHRRQNTATYPILLPVSLRCLLDTSTRTANGSVLHTYVLQGMYALLQLKVGLDYDDLARDSVAFFYQEYFLDDAIPTPEPCCSTSTMQSLHLNNEKSAVAYATGSSATSAKQDGQAFAQDPLWTLLSRMRILPRLAQLLGDEMTTTEAIVAMLGILMLLVQRSPGAATAIVQHPTLMRDLLRRCSNNDTNKITTITLRLCGLLTRQSRTAAKALEEMVPLTQWWRQTNDACAEHKWALVLWRTRLRYGLSLNELPTMLTLAAPHCALGQQDRLAPFFYSAFAVIVHAIRPLLGKNGAKVQEDDRALLSQAGVWLSSSRRQALQYLVDSSTSQPLAPSQGGRQLVEWLQFHTSILRYIDAWLILSRTDYERDTGEFKLEEISERDEERCIEAILALLQNDQVKIALEIAFRHCFQTELSFLPIHTADDLEQEAASCAFVEALLALATTVSHSFDSDQRTNSLVLSVRQFFLMAYPSSDTMAEIEHGMSSVSERIRRCWLNRTHASLTRFLAHTSSSTSIDPVTQSLGLTVIGRLERGEESTATLLFSCDNLFHSHYEEDAIGPSAVSTFFVRQLCLTAQTRSQLDHSFKLRYALGITSDRLGPFELQSLRSDVDRLSSEAAQVSLLPLGSLWLWKTFAGTVVDPQIGSEAIPLLATALQIVCNLEKDKMTGSALADYAGHLSPAGRLYYAMNLCLQPEAVIGSSSIAPLVDRLIDRYGRHMGTSIALGFAEECESHAEIKSKDKPTAESEEEAERQLAQLLDPSKGPSTGNAWSNSQIRAVQAFVGDMCEAFLEYGAQYPFFITCLRLFLASDFPSQIRCDLIERLRDVLHLLSLPEDKDMARALAICLAGGLPSVDQSLRDNPDLLDAAASVLAKGKNVRSDTSFAVTWAIALLARSLAIHVKDESEGGLSASKRRIELMEESFVPRLLNATECFVISNGTVQDLIAVCLETGNDCRPEFRSISGGESWRRAVALLSKL